MAQIQCPNCKMYKVALRRDHVSGSVVGGGSCLLWIIPPVGLLMVLGGAIVNLLQKITGDNRLICLNCKYVFWPEAAKKVEAKTEVIKKPVQRSNTQPVSDQEMHIGWKVVAGWFFGCWLLAIGLGGIFAGDITSSFIGLSWILCGLWALPPIAKKVNGKIKIATPVKVLIIIGLIALGGLMMPLENLQIS